MATEANDTQDVRAVARFVRISPKKARLVIDLVRGKDTEEAKAILRNSPQRAAGIIHKLVQSCEANAEHNYEMDPLNLYIKEAYVDGGPRMKRIKPRAMGRADVIQRRTSHITLVVSENEGG